MVQQQEAESGGGIRDRESPIENRQSEAKKSILSAIELTLLPGVGTITQNRIWKNLRELSELFAMDADGLESFGIPAEVFGLIRSRSLRDTAAEIYDWGGREGCRFLLRGHPDYPAFLEEIFDPPLVLYARGQAEALKKVCIAIVGTRRPTVYGLQMAQGKSRAGIRKATGPFEGFFA